jgi:hypothetical protein
MRKDAKWFGAVLVLLLLWELAWVGIIFMQSRCSGGTCVIEKNLVLLYFVLSLAAFVAVYVLRAHLEIPKSWNTALWIVMVLHVVWVVEISGEQTINGDIKTNEAAIDSLVIERRSQATTGK